MRTKMVTFLAVLALTAVFMLPAAHANLIVNPSFETGTPGTAPGVPIGNIDAVQGFTTVFAGDTTISGWFVSGLGSVDWVGPDYWKASDGVRSIDMTGTVGNGIMASTSFDTTEGVVYKVTFDLSGNFTNNVITNRDLRVTVGNESTDYPVTKPAGWSTLDLKWVSTDFYFTADAGTSSTLVFEGLSSDIVRGPVIDNVQANVVPIPGALVLLGAGLVRLVGYSRRKRALA